jgi:hypothetical protein
MTMNSPLSITLQDIDGINEQIPELSGQITITKPEPDFMGNYSYVYRGTLNNQSVSGAFKDMTVL